MKGVTYWRGLVAAAATIEVAAITQFSPEGFAEAIGQNLWYRVQLGPLVLQHDGEWAFRMLSEETTRERMMYAHKNGLSALAALRKAVAPDEPAYAKIAEAVYGREQT